MAAWDLVYLAHVLLETVLGAMKLRGRSSHQPKGARPAERTAARAAKSGLPKAPKTAYNFFAALRRHEVIAANPGAKPPIISMPMAPAI